MRILNVGIIGYGLSGRIFHGAILDSLNQFKIKKILTSNPIKQVEACQDFKDVEVVEDVDSILNDDNIDLVIVATPNISHAELAKKVMESGKHVVIEKPFTVNSIEGEELIKISKKTNKILSVFHNRRFDGDFKTIKKIISENSIGEIVEFESHFDRFRNTFKENAWREENLEGSGILYDLGSHLIDQSLDLFGLPEEIYADIRAQRKGEADDNFELILYYPGLKVTLKAGMLVKESLPRFILLGTDGSYVKYGFDIQEEELKNGKRPLDGSWGKEPKEMSGVVNNQSGRTVYESEKGDYRDYYKNIYNVIQHGKKLKISCEDGLNVIKIIEAAVMSNEEKRRISLEW